MNSRRKSPAAGRSGLVRAGSAFALMAAAMYTPAALGQIPCALANKVRVDAAYQPDPGGGFNLIRNWFDYSVHLPDVQEASPEDLYNFTWLCGTAPTPATQYTVGAGVNLADPTVLQIGEWFYITGTNGESFFAPPNTSRDWDVNFVIYRTKDFANFEVHMLAFAPNDLNQLSEQYIDWNPVPPVLHLNNGKWFSRLWAPHLYMDPTTGGSDPFVYLTFAAIEHGSIDNQHSVYHVRIRRSKFVEWLTKDPVNDDGPRFADQRHGLGWQAWHGYTHDGSWHYDGGAAVGRLIPSSISANPNAAGTDCSGPGMGKFSRKIIFHPVLGYNVFWGFEHNCQSNQASVLEIDPFMFIDPKLGVNNTWKRVLLYNWDGRTGSINSAWGNHIAAHPALNSQFELHKTVDSIPLAAARNKTNRIFALSNGIWQWVDNGAVAGGGNEWRMGAVAEGAAAFYLPQTDRYYLIYSRNPVGAASYQLVYRMTEPGQPFSSLQLSNWNDMDAPEHMLLRATDLTRNQGWSFGHAEQFNIVDCNGHAHPYLSFFVKQEGSNARTVLFKELTLEPDGSGRLKQLYECAYDPSRDIRFFRVPVCIAQRNHGTIVVPVDPVEPGDPVDPTGPGGTGGDDDTNP